MKMGATTAQAPRRRRSSGFPLRIKAGSSVVVVYDQSARFPYYRVVHWLDGKRVMRTFRDLDEARTEAQLKAAELSRGDIASAEFSRPEALIYGRAIELLKDSGVGLDAAAAQFAEAARLLLDASLPLDILIAVREYIRRQGAEPLIPTTVASAVDDLFQARRVQILARADMLCLNGKPDIADLLSERKKRHVETLRYHLTRFAAAFPGDLHTVSPAQVRDFLSQLGLAPRTLRNFRASIHLLVRHSIVRRFVPPDFDLVRAIQLPTEDALEEVGVFRPLEFVRLLTAADEDLRASLAIGGFAGLRQQEILRLDWADVRFDEGVIVVRTGRSKTGSRRTVPISPNLAEWLFTIPVRHGKVWPHSQPYYYEALKGILDRAKIDWKDNGLRHSFGSYRLATVKNAHQVAGEMGNSPAIVERHYKALVFPSDAARWWEIRPGGSMPPVPGRTEGSAAKR